MRLTHLVKCEIGFRKLSFALSLLSVAVAIAGLVGAQALLRSDEILTAEILNNKYEALQQSIAASEQAVSAAGAELNDEIRKQMLGLGFNVLIVPETQDLAELHLTGGLTETMPETYVDKLASSEIVSINHLLPTICGRLPVTREDRQFEAIVQGTRGEVPIMHRGLKKPLLDAVEPGGAVVGYEVQQKLGLAIDDRITISGKNFTVTKLHPQRGSADDVTIWINLRQAQELLGMENVINAILALECECAGDRITQIRQEIAAILPGTKVVERYSQALARAEARAKAKQTAEQALAQQRQQSKDALLREKQARLEIERRHAGLAAVLVPLVMVACAVWIGVLAMANVRQRNAEIGILRAIGMSTRQVLMVFLTRSAVIGLAGGLLGCLVGLLVGAGGSGLGFAHDSFGQILDSRAVVAVVGLSLLIAPLLAMVASWLPILLGVQKDPAILLRTE